MLKKKDMATGPAVDGPVNDAGKPSSRRGFLKGAIISTIALTASAGAAKKAGDYLFKPDFDKLAEADELMAEKAWKDKKLVLMSKAEKDEMISRFKSGLE